MQDITSPYLVNGFTFLVYGLEDDGEVMPGIFHEHFQHMAETTAIVGFLKHIEEGAPDGRNPYATTTVLFRVRVVVLAGMFLYGFRLNLPAGFMVLAWNVRQGREGLEILFGLFFCQPPEFTGRVNLNKRHQSSIGFWG